MKNHGAIVASDSVENAVIEAITLEAAARYHLECVAIGGTEIAEAEVLGGKTMYRRHYLPQMWRANLTRLRQLRSRPVRPLRLLSSPSAAIPGDPGGSVGVPPPSQHRPAGLAHPAMSPGSRRRRP